MTGTKYATIYHFFNANEEKKLECGPMPNVLATLPNIGGAPSVQCRKVWLTTTATVPCSNTAKMRNLLKLLAGVPQTNERSQPLVDQGSPYCGDM